jgi:Acetyltransferase (GNAT) family.
MYHTLTHHGILGQRWGVRRYQNEDGTLTEAGKKKYRRSIGDSEVQLLESKRLNGSYHITSKGKKIGDVIVDDEGDTDHIDWIGIKPSERRKGYGQKALDIVIQDSIERGKKYVTLDAAGLDPAAIHIYEKKDFSL